MCEGVTMIGFFLTQAGKGGNVMMMMATLLLPLITIKC